MNILVIGQGGREHSICQKLVDSPLTKHVYCAPGNVGMIHDGIELIGIEALDFEALLQFVKEKEVTYTVVGPEAPLAAGIVDVFRAAGLAILGPTQAAAQIEGSKDFAKRLMNKYQIPTAKHQTFTDLSKAIEYVKVEGAPIVIKADGLAAGKGVTVAQTVEEAIKALKDIFSEVTAKVVIEECLVGQECSYLTFVSEKGIFPMITSRDHKAIFDGNRGPNTGGMGVFSPVPEVTTALEQLILETIVLPTVEAMKDEKRPFTGILYTGLMLTEEGPKVIEFNARFGDPETQVLLQQLDSDLAQVFYDLLHNQMPKLTWKQTASVGVVIASIGYPGKFHQGVPLPDLTNLPHDIQVYYAGVAENNQQLVSAGGRVLLVTTTSQTKELARKRLYDWLETMDFSHFYYRSDIGM